MYLMTSDKTGERRKANDRRQAERHGKFDRRKNRCESCCHFALQAAEKPGYCKFHDTSMEASAFACTQFQFA